MKKTKLIATISSLGVLASATPIIATSCSENSRSGSYYVIHNQKVSLPTTFSQSDINNLVPQSYTFSDGVSRSALFLNGDYVEAALITELRIQETDSTVILPTSNFLSTCTNLRILDIKGVKTEQTASDLTNALTSIPWSNLVEVAFPTWVEKEGVGHALSTVFFSTTPTGLKKADLSGLEKPITVTNNFFKGCTGLEELILPDLSEVTVIGSSFLDGCSSLKSVDNLNQLTKIKGFAYNFLNGCSSLTSVTFPKDNLITTIGHSVLSGCSSLKSIDLSPLTSVTIIGNDFLKGCSSLTSIDLSQMEELQTLGAKKTLTASIIGTGFLNGCNALTTVNMGSILATNVSTLGSTPEPATDNTGAFVKYDENDLDTDPNYEPIKFVETDDAANYLLKFPNHIWISNEQWARNLEAEEE